MSVVVDVAVPAEEFALSRTLEAVPDAIIEVEQLATHSRKWVMPFLWVTDTDPADFETAIEADPTVQNLTVIDRNEEVGLYAVDWSERVATRIDSIIDRRGSVLEATATDGIWFFTFRFFGQKELDTFQDCVDEKDISYEVLRLYTEEAKKHRKYNLTTKQRDVLVTALDAGYFDVPRKTNLPELADSLDISSNAASGRLRRAIGNLVQNTVTSSPPQPADTDESEAV